MRTLRKLWHAYHDLDGSALAGLGTRLGDSVFVLSEPADHPTRGAA